MEADALLDSSRLGLFEFYQFFFVHFDLVICVINLTLTSKKTPRIVRRQAQSPFPLRSNAAKFASLAAGRDAHQLEAAGWWARRLRSDVRTATEETEACAVATPAAAQLRTEGHRCRQQ